MKDPNYLNDKPSRPAVPDYLKKPPTTDLSKEHEKDTARKSGGQRVRGSGAVFGRPGDVKGNKELQELKATEKTDTRINLEWLRKITFEAMTQGRYPMVNMRFVKLKAPTPQDWVLIPADVYEKLKGREI